MAVIEGTNAKDIIEGTDLGDTIRGLRGDDTILGHAGRDRLYGNDGHDRLIGGAGNDLLVGGAGEDKFVGNQGKDTFDGTDSPQEEIDGSGFDHVDYSSDGGNLGVIVDLGAGTATDSYGHTDTLIDIEMVLGTRFADSLTGGNDSEDFRGLAGNDVIDGGGGSDRVTYSSDIFYGGEMGVVVNLATGTARDGFGDTDTLSNIERVRGTVFSDEMIGNGGDNRFELMSGDDFVNGRGGSDTAAYFNDHFFTQNGNGITGIRADLATGRVVDTSGYNIDTLVSIENVIGSIFGDDIRGKADANTLDGREGNDLLLGRGGDDELLGRTGNDTLRGGVGNDVLDGGAGDDILMGNAGADTFTFKVGDGHDTIRDFENGIERMEVVDWGYGNGWDVVALATQVGNNVVITNDEDAITLINFDLADLDGHDFIVYW